MSDKAPSGNPNLLPVSTPSDYMAKWGVHPHISHEHDIPKLVAEMVRRVDALGHEVAKAYDADKNTTWREYAKHLAGRIKNQRREIERLHAKVRELRADVHERDERIAQLEAEISAR